MMFPALQSTYPLMSIMLLSQRSYSNNDKPLRAILRKVGALDLEPAHTVLQ